MSIGIFNAKKQYKLKRLKKDILEYTRGKRSKKLEISIYPLTTTRTHANTADTAIVVGLTWTCVLGLQWYCGRCHATKTLLHSEFWCQPFSRITTHTYPATHLIRHKARFIGPGDLLSLVRVVSTLGCSLITLSMMDLGWHRYSDIRLCGFIFFFILPCSPWTKAQNNSN